MHANQNMHRKERKVAILHHCHEEVLVAEFLYEV